MPPSGAAPDADPPSGWIEQAAPAKLNLYLKVVGRRADGYHLLDSLAGFASIGDRVRVSAAAQPAFRVQGPFSADVPAGGGAGDNLVVKAVRMLADAVGRPPDIAVDLTKSLPVAAGLGGGSADAAATLRALAALWEIGEDDPRLVEVAARLGADVPVCLMSRTGRMRGVGEEVTPVRSLAGLPVLLVNPGVPVSTPDVFRAFAGAFSEPLTAFDLPEDEKALADWLGSQGNDLEAPAIGLAPVIGDVVTAIGGQAGCRLARMSGSGATCFGLFATQEECEAAAARIGEAHPGWWAEAGRLI